MKKYIILFSVFYLALSVIIDIVLHFFDIGNNVPIAFLLLATAVVFSGEFFVRDNKRSPIPGEKSRLAWGAVPVFIVSHALSFAMFYFSEAGAELKQFSLLAILIVIGIAIALVAFISFWLLKWLFGWYVGLCLKKMLKDVPPAK
jgi:hypothetical protein